MYTCDICRSLTGRFAIILQCPHDTECARSDAKTRDHPCNFEQRVQLAFCQVFCSLTALFNRVLQIGVWVRLSNPSCACFRLSRPAPTWYYRSHSLYFLSATGRSEGSGNDKANKQIQWPGGLHCKIHRWKSTIVNFRTPRSKLVLFATL